MDCLKVTCTLPNGTLKPLLGFGTFRIQGQKLIYDVLDVALRVGFRSFDTAAVYHNEQHIGVALKELLPKYNLTRGDIFLTSKLSPHDHGGGERTLQAVKQSLNNLGTNYLDLYLIHWPGASGVDVHSTNNAELRTGSWKTLVELNKKNILRNIGVSNYTVRHLKELLSNCYGVKPAVNQVEWHPHYHQPELLAFCRSENIVLQAYSSLGSSSSNSLLKDEVVANIARKLEVSPAQILLRWAFQQGIAIIPKAVTSSHIKANTQLNFVIPDGDMEVLSNLQVKEKYAWDPNTVL